MALPNASEQIQEIQQTEMQVVQSALSSDVFMQMFMFQVKLCDSGDDDHSPVRDFY